MNKLKLTRLAAAMAAALSLAACGGSDKPTEATSPLLLDNAQAQLTSNLQPVCDQISGATPAESPLNVGGFLCKVEGTVSEVANGPDSLLTGLVKSVAAGTANPSPEALQQAFAEMQVALTGGTSTLDPSLTYPGLQAPLTSLATNLPCALMTLVKQECTEGADPTAQLAAFTELFQNGGNPFAGTPLEALGAAIPSGDAGSGDGPTGTPLDALLGPLQQVLAQGAGGGTPSLPDGELLDALGQGLSLVGGEIAKAEPQVADVPVAGNIVTTLGDLFSSLGTTVNDLEAAPGEDVGNLLNTTLTNVSNLLTGETGLLGTLAAASQQQQLIDAVAQGNSTLNDGIDTLTGTLNEQLLSTLDAQALEPLLGALAPLTCTLKLFGDCDTTSGDPAAALQGLLGSLAGAGGAGNPLSGLAEQITGALAGAGAGGAGGSDPAAALQDLIANNPLAAALSKVPGLGSLFGGV